MNTINFSLPVLENIKNGDLVPISIEVKNLQKIGAISLVIQFDQKVLIPFQSGAVKRLLDITNPVPLSFV